MEDAAAGRAGPALDSCDLGTEQESTAKTLPAHRTRSWPLRMQEVLVVAVKVVSFSVVVVAVEVLEQS